MSQQTKKRNQIIALLFLLLIGFLSLFIGVEDLSLRDLGSFTSEQFHLLLISRLPRLLSIILVGASLSISGLIMQTITQNSFVSASTSGTMDWAKLGIIFVMLFLPTAPKSLKILVSFSFALFGSFLFMFIISKISIKSIVLVPLMGIMIGNVVDGITTFIAYQFDLLQNVNSWLQGSFSLVIKGSYEFLFFSIPLMMIAYSYANYFTIAGMGENMAQNLGINHKRVVQVGLVIVAIISAITLVSVGNLPFIGLVIPNLVRIRHGNSIQHTLFETAYLGSLFVLLSDIVGRLLIYPHEVSVGVVISVVGSVLFLIILLRKEKK